MTELHTKAKKIHALNLITKNYDKLTVWYAGEVWDDNMDDTIEFLCLVGSSGPSPSSCTQAFLPTFTLTFHSPHPCNNKIENT